MDLGIPCLFQAWGRACRQCENRLFPDCHFASLDEFNAFRAGPLFQESSSLLSFVVPRKRADLLFSAAPFHRHPVPYNTLFRHVRNVFKYLHRHYYNRHRRDFKDRFLGMTNEAVLEWMEENEPNPYYHPHVERLALKVLRERSTPPDPELAEALAGLGLNNPTILFQTTS